MAHHFTRGLSTPGMLSAPVGHRLASCPRARTILSVSAVYSLHLPPTAVAFVLTGRSPRPPTQTGHSSELKTETGAQPCPGWSLFSTCFIQMPPVKQKGRGYQWCRFHPNCVERICWEKSKAWENTSTHSGESTPCSCICTAF